MVPEESRLQEFSQELRRSFSGEIRFDRFSRVLYSSDASIYQIEPLGIVIPRTHDDVAAVAALAWQYAVPLLSRGGGTSISGQTVGSAVVIDYSKHMNGILEINQEDRWARVQPGVVLDHLNARGRGLGLQFGPDVSTGSRATLGGMIGNNSCGSHSIVYGKTSDYVREIRALLAGGTECRFHELSPEEWNRKITLETIEGRLYKEIDRLAQENRGEILLRYPKIMRRVGGYNLDSLLAEGTKNISGLIVGSEGTLVTCTEAVVDLVPLPRSKAINVAHFSELAAAMDAVEPILALQPAAVELLDKMILDLTRLQPAFARKMTFVEGDPAAVLIVEFYGDTDQEVSDKVFAVENVLRARGFRSVCVYVHHPEDQANVWAIRKAGLGLLSSLRGDSKPSAFVEDTAVAPEVLSRYVGRFRELLTRYNTEAGFYGHASVGCLHVRPLINLKQAADVEKMVEIAAAVKDLVVEFEGAMSAEHGDGLTRSHWNRELFGDQLYGAFCELKKAFDPLAIMNPGKIVNSPPMTANLRYGPDYATVEPATCLDFSGEGGFARAIEQCSGLGACRKTDSATMCPSYRVTKEEEHCTRGRANALRALISGRLPEEEFTSHRIFQALDLCLECKACKTECPANVDMAKLKYEFLSHYNARHGTPLRSLVFGNIAAFSRLGSATAPFSNWVLRSFFFRKMMHGLIKTHPNRSFPPFTRETFRHWLNKRPHRATTAGSSQVVLFVDTYINYNEPGIGKAALKLLESTGAQVMVPDVVCCGRPMISKGLLDQAKENARKNVEVLTPFIESGAYVVGCEPSCLLTLRDEYPDLLRTRNARNLADRSLLLEEYLVQRLETGKWHPSFTQSRRSLLIHAHCHQKSLVGTAPSVKLLCLPPGFSTAEIDSGCCGMAGAFGYEKEHYEISMQIGEMSLFPAIRSAAPETIVVASGISCRQQIQHGTGRKARHFAEVLAEVLVGN